MNRYRTSASVKNKFSKFAKIVLLVVLSTRLTFVSYYLGLKRKFSFSHFRENLFSFLRKYLNKNIRK
jgi:hypothetical protein